MSRNDVLCELSACFCLLRALLEHVAAGEAEIADLDPACMVDEDVARLEVPVCDACGVQVAEAPKNLARDCLHVALAELLLGPDDFVKVRRHVRHDQQHLLEVRGRHLHEVQQVHEVVVPQSGQEDDLSHDAFPAVRRVFDVLDGYLLAEPAIVAKVDSPVSALAQRLARHQVLRKASARGVDTGRHGGSGWPECPRGAGLKSMT
mmetsp:Transcript_56898/g.164882  ORF Transcript_56898/g.164882 Transcript_56898/m.164882 type:complete len:205 (+) Transcript_56898:1222-1836(+)